MLAFNKCPICGGEMTKKNVEKLLHGGNDTAIIKVEAEVCLHCGERLYSVETVHKFEDVRKKLAQRDTSGFMPLGKSYQVA